MRYREILADHAGTIPPKAPLTPEQARREADRKAALNRRIQDAQSACAQRLRDLRSKL
jgi:hypothetical protein